VDVDFGSGEGRIVATGVGDAASLQLTIVNIKRPIRNRRTGNFMEFFLW
jgi:hypothetical protein